MKCWKTSAIFVTKTKTRIIARRSVSTKTRIMTICMHASITRLCIERIFLYSIKTKIITRELYKNENY